MEHRSSGIPRRAILGAGAAGVGASALGALSVGEAFAQTPGGTSLTSAGQALGLPPAALPLLVPATYAGVVNFADIQAIGTNGSAGQASYRYNGLYQLSNWLDVALPIEAGGRLYRVDVYFWRFTSGSARFLLMYSQVDGGGNYQLTSYITTNTATNLISAAYQPASPVVVGQGQKLYLETGDTSSDCVLVGAIYQYKPARPQLNLLTAPVRVYDSRPGSPTPGAHVPLGGGVRSNLSATWMSSGVPVGADAILANVTVVDTVSSGFLVAYRNGIVQPNASTINWFGSGQILANTTVIALDASSQFAAAVGSNSSTNFFVDVIGYYV